MLADAIAWLAAAAPGARLSADSRRIAQGDVFIAHAAAPEYGIALDGRRFIDDAIARGAVAVIHDTSDFIWDARLEVPHLGCADLRAIAGPLANAHYGHPDQDLFTVAVTGTNGKTSCSQWLAAALSRNGRPAVVIGTFGVGLYENGRSGTFDTTGYTTPDAVQLQAALAKARDAGAGALTIEASSIGLQQQRMAGLHVDVALLTNLTRDHLDYHGDMAAYESAKTILFDWPGLQHAVLNFDDPMGARVAARLRATAPAVRITGYTIDAAGPIAAAALAAFGCDDVCLSAEALHAGATGIRFQLRCTQPAASQPATTLDRKSAVHTQLVGDFNVSNVLGVLGVLLARGMPLANAMAAIEALQPVAGRMQQIGGVDQPLVVIDYAHTPDALEKTLASLRQVAQDRHGALWCVFGCGGDRDPGKRPQMGAISRAADHVVVTSDNPRGEAPGAIIADIMAGFGSSDAVNDTSAASAPPQVIEDRATAILWALRHAAKNDVVLLAGKGHENTQEIRGRKLQFLDADHAALALAARATMKGLA